MNRIFADRKSVALTAETGGQPAPPPPSGWMHDIRGDLVIGAAVGLVAFSVSGDVPFKKVLGAALIGGVSGAAYFTKTREVQEARRQARRETAKSKKLKKAATSLLEAPIKEEGENGR